MGVLLPWIPVRLFQAVASLTEARCRVSQWEGVSRPPLQGLRPPAESESCLALILMFQSFAESGSPRPEKKRDSLERFELRSRGPLFYRKRGTCSVRGNDSGCISGCTPFSFCSWWWTQREWGCIRVLQSHRTMRACHMCVILMCVILHY